MRFVSLLAPLALVATPALASRPDDGAALGLYLHARAADVGGDLETAARGYAAAFATAPDDVLLATRTYRQALNAGDQPLATRAAAAVVSLRGAPADAKLLLIGDAIGRRDWADADARLSWIANDDVFSFVVPLIRAWTLVGRRAGDPLAVLAAIKPGTLGAAYAGEHRALILLALHRWDEGEAAIRTQLETSGTRGIRLQLAAASIFARNGKRDRANAMLAGASPVLAQARALLDKRKPIEAAVETPAQGVAELYARLAVDLNHERSTPLAVSLSRMATFLAPANAETWLVAGELLASAGQYDGALAALAKISPNDPYAEEVRQARVAMLVGKGAKDQALAEATRDASDDRSASDWARVGDLYGDLDRPADAAAAYAKAVALTEAGDKTSLWSMLLLQGGALEQAGRWGEAKAILERAVSLAPNEPAALNYLGYAQLERRENLDGATALIERASQLKPDDAAITDSLGWTYFVRGDLPRAIPLLERAAKGEPAETPINEHLGDAYWTAGRRYEARYAWRAALIAADEKEAARLRVKIDGGLTPAVAAP